MTKTNVKQMVLCGLAMALVFVFTAFVAIPIGQFGYINVGDSIIMIFASVLNPLSSILVGGIGSALADLYLGYSQYALFTFIAKGMEGWIVSLFFRFCKDKIAYLGYVIGAITMVFIYYLADSFLYGDMIVAMGGIGFNVTQAMISLIIAIALGPLLKTINKKYFLD